MPDYFLHIDGIPGESADVRHQDAIEVVSWSWGVAQSAPPVAGGGAGGGKAAFQALHVVMRVNRAAPHLFLACARGQHFRQAVLAARKPGGDQQDFLQITLSDVVVSGFEETGQDEILERVALTFGRIEYEYQRQGHDGRLQGAEKAGWDLASNTDA